MQEPQVKHPGWQSFVSLGWYAGIISFLFRFLAMTSEPLLAVGVILSAADFLQQGHLMAHNTALQGAWSWAQAISIEASTGPTLAFSLDAFRAGDKIKGRLYATLAALLFIVGGCMLYLQLISNATGMSEAAVSPWVLYPLLALRVLVASGIVALLCSKHLRFSGLVADVPAEVTAAPPATISPSLDEVLLKLDERYQQRMEALYQKTVETVKITIAEHTNPQIPAITQAMLASPLQIESTGQSSDDRASLQGLVNGKLVDQGRFASKEQAVAEALRRLPGASVEQIAQEAGCSPRTAQRWLDKQRSEQT